MVEYNGAQRPKPSGIDTTGTSINAKTQYRFDFVHHVESGNIEPAMDNVI